MGCDIHGAVEVRQWPGRLAWTYVADVGALANRNYNVFGRLFGVRSYPEVAPIAFNRGMPSDAGDKTLQECETNDYGFHSHTWATWAELKGVDLDSVTPMAKPVYWKRLFRIMEILAADFGDDNVRMVVWFDN